MPARSRHLPTGRLQEGSRAMHKLRMFLSAGTIATVLTLLSVVSALAGDITGPLPK